MSEKQEEKSTAKVDQNNDDSVKSPSIQTTEKDPKAKENERSIDEIEKELDELRPEPPSPETKHRIEEEEKQKDRQMEENKSHKQSPTPSNKQNDTEHHHDEHQANELTPGQPDPTVNDNVKIPVLNDRGDIELKPQQGSALHKHQENPSPNDQPKTEEKK